MVKMVIFMLCIFYHNKKIRVKNYLVSMKNI